MAVNVIFCLAVTAFGLASAEVVNYPDLDKANATGQFAFTIETTPTSDKTVFDLHECPSMYATAACHQPSMSADNGDKLRINFSMNTMQDLVLYQNYNPSSMKLKLCYSKDSTTDRPWRSFKNNTAKDNSCPITAYTWKWNATTAEDILVTDFSVLFPLSEHKNMVTATFYPQLLVYCISNIDGATVVCHYANTKTGSPVVPVSTSSNASSTNSSANYVSVTAINPISPTLTTAVAIGSAIGPLFLAVYFFQDLLRHRKHVPAATSK